MDGSELLFDNVADPLQMNNLAGDPAFADLQAQMKSAMHAEMERIGDKFHVSSYYRDNWTKNRIIYKNKVD